MSLERTTDLIATTVDVRYTRISEYHRRKGWGVLPYGILWRRQQKIPVRSPQREYTFPLVCRASLLFLTTIENVVECGKEEWVGWGGGARLRPNMKTVVMEK